MKKFPIRSLFLICCSYLFSTSIMSMSAFFQSYLFDMGNAESECYYDSDYSYDDSHSRSSLYNREEEPSGSGVTFDYGIEVLTSSKPKVPVALKELAAMQVGQSFNSQQLDEMCAKALEMGRTLCFDEYLWKLILQYVAPVNMNQVDFLLEMSDKGAYAAKTVKSDAKSAVERNSVEDAIQVGFLMVSKVEKIHKPWVLFAKQKIISCGCTCQVGKGEICSHVSATILFRIKFPKKVMILPPLTELLNSLQLADLHLMIQTIVKSFSGDTIPLVANTYVKCHSTQDETVIDDATYDNTDVSQQVIQAMENFVKKFTGSLKSSYGYGALKPYSNIITWSTLNFMFCEDLLKFAAQDMDMVLNNFTRFISATVDQNSSANCVELCRISNWCMLHPSLEKEQRDRIAHAVELVKAGFKQQIDFPAGDEMLVKLEQPEEEWQAYLEPVDLSKIKDQDLLMEREDIDVLLQRAACLRFFRIHPENCCFLAFNVLHQSVVRVFQSITLAHDDPVLELKYLCEPIFVALDIVQALKDSWEENLDLKAVYVVAQFAALFLAPPVLEGVSQGGIDFKTLVDRWAAVSLWEPINGKKMKWHLHLDPILKFAFSEDRFPIATSHQLPLPLLRKCIDTVPAAMMRLIPSTYLVCYHSLLYIFGKRLTDHESLAQNILIHYKKELEIVTRNLTEWPADKINEIKALLDKFKTAHTSFSGGFNSKAMRSFVWIIAPTGKSTKKNPDEGLITEMVRILLSLHHVGHHAIYEFSHICADIMQVHTAMCCDILLTELSNESVDVGFISSMLQNLNRVNLDAQSLATIREMVKTLIEKYPSSTKPNCCPPYWSLFSHSILSNETRLEISDSLVSHAHKYAPEFLICLAVRLHGIDISLPGTLPKNCHYNCGFGLCTLPLPTAKDEVMSDSTKQVFLIGMKGYIPKMAKKKKDISAQKFLQSAICLSELECLSAFLNLVQLATVEADPPVTRSRKKSSKATGKVKSVDNDKILETTTTLLCRLFGSYLDEFITDKFGKFVAEEVSYHHRCDEMKKQFDLLHKLLNSFGDELEVTPDDVDNRIFECMESKYMNFNMRQRSGYSQVVNKIMHCRDYLKSQRLRKRFEKEIVPNLAAGQKRKTKFISQLQEGFPVLKKMRLE